MALIKVIDFGVAMSIAPGHPEDIHSQRIVGTLGYMAPELVFQEASYSSDLYSAGVILYQLMSGRRPLEFGRAKTKEALKAELKRVLREKRRPLLNANPLLVNEPKLAAIVEMVDHMIAVDPDRRPSLETLNKAWVDEWESLPEALVQGSMAYHP
jgi:serine/threonine-protein kinase